MQNPIILSFLTHATRKSEQKHHWDLNSLLRYTKKKRERKECNNEILSQHSFAIHQLITKPWLQSFAYIPWRVKPIVNGITSEYEYLHTVQFLPIKFSDIFANSFQTKTYQYMSWQHTSQSTVEEISMNSVSDKST